MQKLRSIAASISVVAALIVLTSAPALAAPPEPTGFVCPVLGGQAGGGQGNSDPAPIVPIGEDTTVIGPDVPVPLHATNMEGAGSPDGTHASPGEADYSPIWDTTS